MIEDKMFYSTEDAATYLKKSKSAIKKAVMLKQLVGVQVDGRTRVFTKAELDAYQASRKPVGRPQGSKGEKS